MWIEISNLGRKLGQGVDHQQPSSLESDNASPGSSGGTTGTGQTVVYYGWQDASESPSILKMRFWLVTPGYRRRSQRGMVRVLIVDLITHSSFVLFSAHAVSVPVFNSMPTEAP